MNSAIACARLTLDDVQHACERAYFIRARVENGLPLDRFTKMQFRAALSKASAHFNGFDWESYPEVATPAEPDPVDYLDLIIAKDPPAINGGEVPHAFQAVPAGFPNNGAAS